MGQIQHMEKHSNIFFFELFLTTYVYLYFIIIISFLFSSFFSIFSIHRGLEPFTNWKLIIEIDQWMI